MAIYETVVILDSLLPPKDIDDTVEHFTKVITDHGGKVRTVDKWGKRRLAYEIQKKQYGFYFAIEFENDGNIPDILQNEYNFNDNILRYLTYRYDKHQLKAMALKKAKTEEKASPAPVKKETEKKPKVEEKPEEVENRAEETETRDSGVKEKNEEEAKDV